MQGEEWVNLCIKIKTMFFPPFCPFANRLLLVFALAGLAQTPAMWLTGSLVLLLFGISSRLTPFAWGLLAAFVLIWTLESFGDLPQWVIDLSPFSHTPLVPAVSYDPVPLVTMTVLSLAISALGLAFWRHRDLP